MFDVMLDLETMGSGPDAAITAIGAVVFDPMAGTLGAEFYQVVNLESAVRSGGVMDASTVLWWMRQNDAARREFERFGATIESTLSSFRLWLLDEAGKDARVWGNGAGFDNVILAGAYRRAGLQAPWSYKNDRCYRTVVALQPGLKRMEGGTRHNALEDAKGQAMHLMTCLRALGGASCV